LIVGKNNVGKSSLLEAIHLYIHKGHLSVIGDMLQSRDEMRVASSTDPDEPGSLVEIDRLMHERHRFEVDGDEIRIGPVGDESKVVSLRMELHAPKSKETVSLARALGAGQPVDLSSEPKEMLVIRASNEASHVRREYLEDPDFWKFTRRRSRSGDKDGSCSFLPARGKSLDDLATWWDSITMTRMEQDVLAGLRLLEPQVERLQFIQRSRRGRSPIIGLTGTEGPVPLGIMGDGMNRILAVLLALATAKDGVLLVDEIENGIHYSVQADLWRLILLVARRANVQVFATTHSWDCIQAFQEAIAEVPGQQGFLVRLVRRNGQVDATVLNERKLAIAAREEIEVR
jgi:hypothetical protein